VGDCLQICPWVTSRVAGGNCLGFRVKGAGFRVQFFGVQGVGFWKHTVCPEELCGEHTVCFTEMRSGSEEGSYLRLIDGWVTQL